VIARTCLTILVGVAAASCGNTRPAPPSVAPSTAGAPSPCRDLRDLHDKDPARLGLEVCTAPAPKGSNGELTITIRRARDQHVLWTDTADAVAQAHLVGNQTPPALQLVIVHEVEPTDAEDAEDAYYVVDLELVDGAIREVNRFRDSGD
jgi:hypothetical protein